MSQEWRQYAVCGMFAQLSEDYDQWFLPEDTEESQEAATLCFQCPVRDACLKAACDSEATDGIWGGQPATVRKKNKHEYETLVDLPNPYFTDNKRSPHHSSKLRPYDPEVDDERTDS